MTLENLVMLLTVAGSLTLAMVTVYRAKTGKDLDATTRRKLDKEAEIAVAKHERAKTMAIIRLEDYVTHDIEYHRQNAAYQAKLLELIELALADRLEAQNIVLPEPPKPPELPEISA